MNKKTMLFSLGLVIILCLSNSVLATLEVDNDDLTPSVNYENLDENEDSLYFEQHITLTNSGNETESLTFELQNLKTDYNLILSQTTLELAAGTSLDLIVSGDIPVNIDQGTSEYGTLKINGTSESTHSLKTDVQSMLEIKELKVYVNGQKVKTVNNDEEKVKNLGPGDEVQLKFQLRNLFDSDYNNGDIEGDITLELYSTSFGEDIDEEETFDIVAGESFNTEEEEIVLAFTVPTTVEEDDYTLKITIQSKDDNKAEYTTEWDLILEVKRENDDLRIEKLTLSPEQVTCNQNFDVTVEVVNYGSNRQRYAALSLINTNLEINEEFPFELPKGTSEDNNIVKTFTLNLGPEVVPGIYPLIASAFYDSNVLDDKETVNLIVEKCTEVIQDIDDESKEQIVEEEEETSMLTSSAIVKVLEKQPYSSEDLMVALMLVAITAVFILIIVMLVTLFK